MLRVVETFSGIGSQAKALKKLGIDFKIINTVEWDIVACCAYDAIHNGPRDLSDYETKSKDEILKILSKYSLSTDGKTPANYNYLRTWSAEALRNVLCAVDRTHNLGSIVDLQCSSLPKKIDLLTYSFPCQDLSICGAWHGNMTGIDRNAHNRSGMLWEVERLLKEMQQAGRKLPKFLLMENVSNILSNTHRKNFEEWQQILGGMGYINQVYTLNASNFGSPQKRVRTYMISALCPDTKRKRFATAYFEKHNLEDRPPMPRKPLAEYLKTDYSIEKYKTEADISNMNDTPSRQKIFADNDVVYDGEKCCKDTVNTLTTKQDRNPTSGLIIYPEHAEGKSAYRNFTPRECIMLMGFDEKDYEAIADSNFQIRKNHYLFTRERIEKLAGNSIVVDVLVEIFRQINELHMQLWSGYIPHNGEKRRYNRRKKSHQITETIDTVSDSANQMRFIL